MGPIDMGPQGCWLAGFVLAVIGALSMVALIVYSVWQLVEHLHFSWI